MSGWSTYGLNQITLKKKSNIYGGRKSFVVPGEIFANFPRVNTPTTTECQTIDLITECEAGKRCPHQLGWTLANRSTKSMHFSQRLIRNPEFHFRQVDKSVQHESANFAAMMNQQ